MPNIEKIAGSYNISVTIQINTTRLRQQQDSLYSFVGSKQNKKDLPRNDPKMSRGCPMGIPRASRGHPEDSMGMYNNAYISKSRNHNDSDLRWCCADFYRGRPEDFQRIS